MYDVASDQPVWNTRQTTVGSVHQSQGRMGSSGLTAPARILGEGSLCALAVFQHLSNSGRSFELIKSVHLYMDDGSVTAIQQEFLLSPGVYTQISEPIPSYFSKFAPKGAEQFMSTLKHLNEADLWQCVLEYHVHTPQHTSIIPLLSVSKNPSLRYIPSLSEDLMLVEKAVRNQEEGYPCMSLFGPTSVDEQQHSCCCSSQLVGDRAQCTLNPLKWNIPVFSGLTVESAEVHGSQGDGVPNETISQVENLQEWGSDLELASPRMFDSCILGSSWSASISSMPFTVMSTPSPTSSMVTNVRKVDRRSWSPSPLVIDSQMVDTYDFHEGSSLSDEAKLVSVSDGSEEGSLCPFDFPAMGSAIFLDGENPSSLAQRRLAKSSKSYCSDESVGKPAGMERQTLDFPPVFLPSEFQNFMDTGCRKDVLLQEPHSFTLTKSVNEGAHVGECLSMMEMLDKNCGPPNQRGPTERMTDITLNELSQYFHMPITQASKELKVGLTVLKKRCREFGIPRWPHRKMKSLDSLIQNIQELAKGPEGKTSAPVMSAVKELEHQKKRMEERPGIELAERTKRLRQACFKASYKKRRQASNLTQQDSGGEISADQVFAVVL